VTRRLGDLLHRGDTAVDRQDEPDALVGEPAQRLARDAVPLLEAARQMPVGVRAELSQVENRESRRADAVHVVVAVDADPSTCVDRGTNALDRSCHVAQEEWIVSGQIGLEEPSRRLVLVVAAPREHRSGDLAHVELACELRDRAGVHVSDRPRARHAGDGTEAVGRRMCA